MTFVYVYLTCVRGERERRRKYVVGESLWELIIASYHVGLEDQTQVVRLSGNHLYLLSRFCSPSYQFNPYEIDSRWNN